MYIYIYTYIYIYIYIGDVKEAVATAQRAGVVVRMVTGDNIHTAIAIAKQCGILTLGGLAMEGPMFRKMTPKELDEALPRLQVLDGLCVLRRTCRQNRLYVTLYTVIILSKHHHHHRY
jgi:hypothetical protein